MFFFFFKQKTAYEMRISDWSSDVCSSDLVQVPSGSRRQKAGATDETADRHCRLSLRTAAPVASDACRGDCDPSAHGRAGTFCAGTSRFERDRKSTRLNSSHSCATSKPSSASQKKKNKKRTSSISNHTNATRM